MKVALTGVTGILGTSVLHSLCSAHHDVRVLVRSSDTRALRGYTAEIFSGDIRDTDSLKSFVTGCDAIIHCAGVISLQGDPDGIVKDTNVSGTENVLSTALACGVRRVIHVSSVHVFRQHPLLEPLDESRQLIDDNFTEYDISKRRGQEIALSYNSDQMEVLVMNPTGIIGPFDYKPSRAGKAIIDIVNGRLPFRLNGGFDFCDSRDVAQAIVNSLEKGVPGSCYILSGKWHSMADIIAVLRDVSGKRLWSVPVSIGLARLGLPFASAWSIVTRREPIFTREALDAIANGNKDTRSTRARQELGYVTRPIQETLTDTCRWFKTQGYLRY